VFIVRPNLPLVGFLLTGISEVAGAEYGLSWFKKSNGYVVFSSSIIYLDLADFFSATKPKSKLLLPFNLLERAGA